MVAKFLLDSSRNIHISVTIITYIIRFCYFLNGEKIKSYTLVKLSTSLLMISAYMLLPIWPLIFSIIFFKPKYLINYINSLNALLKYFKALKSGPVEHYLKDVVSSVNSIPITIQGNCIKCGNCCLNKDCFFLEQQNETEFICGIYDSPLRRYSNCNSFPLHAVDIARYSCPSYKVIGNENIGILPTRSEYPIHQIKPITDFK